MHPGSTRWRHPTSCPTPCPHPPTHPTHTCVRACAHPSPGNALVSAPPPQGGVWELHLLLPPPPPSPVHFGEEGIQVADGSPLIALRAHQLGRGYAGCLGQAATAGVQRGGVAQGGRGARHPQTPGDPPPSLLQLPGPAAATGAFPRLQLAWAGARSETRTAPARIGACCPCGSGAADVARPVRCSGSAPIHARLPAVSAGAGIHGRSLSCRRCAQGGGVESWSPCTASGDSWRHVGTSTAFCTLNWRAGWQERGPRGGETGEELWK
jgi:hypothetical protein